MFTEAGSVVGGILEEAWMVTVMVMEVEVSFNKREL